MFHRLQSHKAQGGFTFAELAFAFAIMVTAALALVSHVSSLYRRNAGHKDRVFAYTKAQSILSELQSYVNRSENQSANTLDTLDDGVAHNTVLTIATENNIPVAPDHAVSGNRKGASGWLWARRVNVRPFPSLNNRNVRYATVKVFRRQGSGDWELLADLSGVVNSVGSSYPPTQVYDVYLVAIENIPGWWVHMDAIRPFVESTITDLEARNPGVKFRTHWITKASYGRDQLYTPAINNAQDSTQDIDNVYLYPGKMPEGSASTYYYRPSTIKARLREDGVLINGYDVANNAHPYALADGFNHGKRLPEERALFNKRVAAGLEKADEPTLRLLLEDMATDPDRYHTAILVNLHGELLPMPAIRNYSDAAKSPAAHPGLRVLTHGERLRSNRGSTVSSSEDVTLRVYAWRTDPNTASDSFTGLQPVTLQIMNAKLSQNVNGTQAGPVTLRIERLPGGVDPGDSDKTYRPFETAPKSTATVLSKEMYWTAEWKDFSGTGGEKYTLIKLYNTPSISPTHGSPPNDCGLYAGDRLYGLDYVPCSTEAANDFSVDLASVGAKPKNTARWRITIPKEVLDGAATGSGLSLEDQLLTIRTRLGDDLTTGQAYPTVKDPGNLSSTFVWWTDLADDVPWTERYQFIGDPRHCPYADLKKGGVNFPNGYNWYFDNFVDGVNNAQPFWPGFDAPRMRDGWLGRLNLDWPRYAQLMRRAMTNSECVFTTLTGFSYYYVGIGGEIGYDLFNGYPSSIPVSRKPYGSSGWGHVDNISFNGAPDLRFQKLIRQSATANYWWGKHWIGELYPDSAHAQWLSTGNLPSGSAVGQFHRTKRSWVGHNLPFGTKFADTYRSAFMEGCTSVFNIGTHTSTFHHQFAPNSEGTLVAAGEELSQNYNFTLPTTAKVSRPFGLNLSYHGYVGDEYWYPTDYPRHTAVIEQSYYRHESNLEGSAVVGLTTPNGQKTAHIVVSGLDTTLDSGSAFIAKYAVLSLIQSYFEAGHPSATNSITLLPCMRIISPTEITELQDPNTVNVEWSVIWKRWDGKSYTMSFPADYTQDEMELEYVLLYSLDGSKTWRYMQDDTPATPGVRPTGSTYLVADTGQGDESYVWPTPSTKFPEGSYLVRVETYRTSESMHYSFHQVKVYLQR